MSGEAVVDWDRAARLLAARDTVLARIIDTVGPVTLELERDAFRSLAGAVVHQQLSMKAAHTILTRFTRLYPERVFPCPAEVLDTTEEALREVGLSFRKIRYLRDLALRFLDGSIVPGRFEGMTDQEIVDQLTTVKGIGRWSAQMFLIFSLGRPNVLPLEDLGFRKAVQRHYAPVDLDGELRRLSARWEPYRTVSTWYLWKSLGAEPALR